MTKEVVQTITHRSIVAEIIYVVYEHGDEKEKREFVGVRFKRSLPSGRFSVDFRSADLQDLIDCADKVRPDLVNLEDPIKQRIAEAQDTQWKRRMSQRAHDESMVPLVKANVRQDDE